MLIDATVTGDLRPCDGGELDKGEGEAGLSWTCVCKRDKAATAITRVRSFPIFEGPDDDEDAEDAVDVVLQDEVDAVPLLRMDVLGNCCKRSTIR